MSLNTTDINSKQRKKNIISNFLNLSGIQLSNILLVMLLVPVITRKIGIQEFGLIMFASRFLQLAATVISYGMTQSGVRDVVNNLNSPKPLAVVFYNTLIIRSIIFLLYLIFLIGLYYLKMDHFNYILLSTPMAIAEVFNPLFFFIGIERLRLFNVANMAANALCILMVVLFINGPANAAWINFIIGGANTLLYLSLVIYAVIKFKLRFYMPLVTDLLKTGKDNFFLTINNISANLQQSVIIFALEHWGTPNILGAYSLSDRIIGQCRNALLPISNAIYPNAVKVFGEGTSIWNRYRNKTRYYITALFFCGSLLLFVLADHVVYFLTEEYNPTASIFLRIMAFVPTISALNALNGLDQLLKHNTANMFKIAILSLLISFVTAFALLTFARPLYAGLFTVIVEISSFLMYEYVVNKTSRTL